MVKLEHFICPKVGGLKPTCAPPLLKVRGHKPPLPPLLLRPCIWCKMYLERYNVDVVHVNRTTCSIDSPVRPISVPRYIVLFIFLFSEPGPKAEVVRRPSSIVRPLLSTFHMFDFLKFFGTAEWNITKLDRKQDLNFLYQVCVFRADRKNTMAALASDWLRHFRLLL